MTRGNLVTAEAVMLSIKTILHPTDFSETSRSAFRLACALARDYGAKLIVLHVYPTPVLPTLGGNVPLPLDAPHDELLDMLEQVQPRDPAIGIERVLQT